MVIHVLVAVAPAMLEGIIVHSLESQPGFRITVTPRTNGDGWVEAASRIVPDAVITTFDADERSAAFLFLHPRTKVLALKHDGRQAFLFELAPERLSLGELSPDGLVSAIREAVLKPLHIDW